MCFVCFAFQTTERPLLAVLKRCAQTRGKHDYSAHLPWLLLSWYKCRESSTRKTFLKPNKIARVLIVCGNGGGSNGRRWRTRRFPGSYRIRPPPLHRGARTTVSYTWDRNSGLNTNVITGRTITPAKRSLKRSFSAATAATHAAFLRRHRSSRFIPFARPFNMRDPPAYRVYTSRPRIRPVYICYYFFFSAFVPSAVTGHSEFSGHNADDFFHSPVGRVPPCSGGRRNDSKRPITCIHFLGRSIQ